MHEGKAGALQSLRLPNKTKKSQPDCSCLFFFLFGWDNGIWIPCTLLVFLFVFLFLELNFCSYKREKKN
jgi:hypothetical protein